MKQYFSPERYSLCICKSEGLYFQIGSILDNNTKDLNTRFVFPSGSAKSVYVIITFYLNFLSYIPSPHEFRLKAAGCRNCLLMQLWHCTQREFSYIGTSSYLLRKQNIYYGSPPQKNIPAILDVRKEGFQVFSALQQSAPEISWKTFSNADQSSLCFLFASWFQVLNHHQTCSIQSP